MDNAAGSSSGSAQPQTGARAKPKLTHVLLKDGERVENTEKISIIADGDTYYLEIKNANQDDHGLYSLFTENEVLLPSGEKLERTSQFNATLYVTPLTAGVIYMGYDTKANLRATIKLRDTQVLLGEDLLLFVSFGSEVYEFIWYKSGKLLHFRPEMKMYETDLSCIVRIKNVMMTDSGVYCCIAKTFKGYAATTATIAVVVNREQPEVSIDDAWPEVIECNEKEDGRILCRVKNMSGTVRVSWFRNGNKLRNGSRLHIEEYGDGHLGVIIHDVKKSDSSVFYLSLYDAATGKTVRTPNCEFHVKRAPKKKLPSSSVARPLESAIACVGGSVFLDCAFHVSDPSFTYVVWYIGNKKVEHSHSEVSIQLYKSKTSCLIKKATYGIDGLVSCELRMFVNNQESVLLCKSTAFITIVPHDYVGRELKATGNHVVTRGFTGRFNEEITVCPIIVKKRHFWQKEPAMKTFILPCDAGDILFEATVARLECENHYLSSVSGPIISQETLCNNIVVYFRNDGNTTIMIFEWNERIMTPHIWFAIEVASMDENFVAIGVTNVPKIEIGNPAINQKIKLRIRVPTHYDYPEGVTTCLRIDVPDLFPCGPRNLHFGKMEDFEKTYTECGHTMGTGTFGKVVLVKDTRNQMRAAKIIKTPSVRKRIAAYREFTILKELDHPKIVHVYQAYQSRGTTILVMDLLWGAELFDRMIRDDNMKESDVIPYVKQILQGLKYLHDQNIVHLDLKPENIMCAHPNSNDIKIVDFGLARVLFPGDKLTTIYGTKDYVAPEVINYDEVTVLADMWSLGVVVYTMLAGFNPFDGVWTKQSTNIIKGEYSFAFEVFKDVSSDAKMFIDSLLTVNAALRMNADQALQHVWIVEGSSDACLAQARSNMRNYLESYKAKWQRAGHMMIVAGRLFPRSVRNSPQGAPVASTSRNDSV